MTTIQTTIKAAPASAGAILAKAYAENLADTGGRGRAAEVLVREYLTGEVQRVHPLGVTDVIFSRRSIEVKTRAGWLVNPYTEDKERALLDWREKSRIMRGAQYIAYSPFEILAGSDKNSMQNFFKVFKVSDFRRFITPYIQVRGKAGLYGIAIQQFYQSAKKTARFLDSFDSTPGWSLKEFSELF